MFDPLTNCVACPLRGRRVVLPNKNPAAKLIVIGEAPGYSEELRGEPFVGASGQVVDHQLQRFGLHRSQCHITNAVLCRPPRALSSAEWKQALQCCRARLEAELKKCAAKTVLALGDKALSAMTGKHGIFKWCGAPLPSTIDSPRTVYGSLHPAFCLRKEGRNYLPILAAHMHRACRHALGRPQKWRWPKLIIHEGPQAWAALKKIRREKLPVAIDLETQGTDPLTAKIMCLGIGNINRVVSLPWDDYDAGKFGHSNGCSEEIKQAVREIIMDRRIRKVFHNAQHDILGLEATGMVVNNFTGDTILGHAVIAPGVRHDLGFATAMEYNADRWKSAFHAGTDSKGEDVFVKRDPEELRTYNCKDVVATARLYHRQTQQIKSIHNGAMLLAQYVELTKLTILMRRRGMRVRTDRMAVHREKLLRRKMLARREIRQLVGAVGYKPPGPYISKRMKKADCMAAFKPSASHHVRGLFNYLGVSSSRVSMKTGAQSFDDETVSNLLGHPKEVVAVAARTLLRFRRWSKLLATYIDGMPVSKRGYVHPCWKVWGTVTRRWSSAEPNMQNIPQNRERPSKVDPRNKRVIVAEGLRSLFAADEGDWLIKGDKSQFELRMIALQAKDTKLLKLYEENADVHTANAYDLFGTQNPTKADRTLAKRFVYAANYGAEAVTIWRNLLVDFPWLQLSDVVRLLDRWFGSHPDLVRWQQRILRKARTDGYVEEPLSGWREYFIGSPDPCIVFNFPIQSGAAWIINNEGLALAKAIDWKSEYLLVQCHDEWVMGCKDPIKSVPKLRKFMTTTATLEGISMCFSVDLKIGRDWGNTIEVKKDGQVREIMEKVEAEEKTRCLGL